VRPVFHPHLIPKATTTQVFTNYCRLPSIAQSPWPDYEGGDNGSLQQASYSQLPEAQAFYDSGADVTAPLVALNHASTGINAIVLGDIYDGTTYPTEYVGDLFFNDLGQGIVRNVSFDAAGNVTSVEQFATGANVVVMIKQGPDGNLYYVNLYYVDLDDGEVGRWLLCSFDHGGPRCKSSVSGDGNNHGRHGEESQETHCDSSVVIFANRGPLDSAILVSRTR
jgi:hypothetical protein